MEKREKGEIFTVILGDKKEGQKYSILRKYTALF